jgi:hypothetical protein
MSESWHGKHLGEGFARPSGSQVLDRFIRQLTNCAIVGDQNVCWLNLGQQGAYGRNGATRREEKRHYACAEHPYDGGGVGDCICKYDQGVLKHIAKEIPLSARIVTTGAF